MQNDFTMSKELGASADDYVSSFLKTRISRKEVEKGVVDQLKVQMMWLEAPGKMPRVVHQKHPRKRLSSRQKKSLKLYQIPKEHQKLVVALYFFLNQLFSLAHHLC